MAIPGTTKPHRMEETIAAASVELTPDDLREIDSGSSEIKVRGARCPETLERIAGRRTGLVVGRWHRGCNAFLDLALWFADHAPGLAAGGGGAGAVFFVSVLVVGCPAAVAARLLSARTVT